MKITILPGDGIGPEVCKQAVSVLAEIATAFEIPIEADEHLIGGAAIREAGSPFPPETEEACVAGDAVLLGAVGSPEFDHLLPDARPEIGLPLPSTTVTTDGWLTRIVAVEQPGCVQLNVSLL